MITTKNTLLALRKNYNIKLDTTTSNCIKRTNQKRTVSSIKLQSKFTMFIASMFLMLLAIQSHSIPINDETEAVGINPVHTFQQQEATEYVYADKSFVVSQGNTYSQIWKNINSKWQEIAVLNDCHRAINANNVSADGSKIALLSDCYVDNISAEIWQDTEKSWKIIGEGYGVRIYFNPKDSNEIILQTYVLLDTKDEIRTALYNLKENNTWEKSTAVTVPSGAYCGGYSQDGKRLFFAGEGKVIILLKDNSNNYIQHIFSLDKADKIFLSPVNNVFIVYSGCHVGFANALTRNTCYVTHGIFNEEDDSCNYSYLTSFTGLPHPEVLNFSTSGNEILIEDDSDAIVFERQENNKWKIVEKFASANNFKSSFSADGSSVVTASMFDFINVYAKDITDNWDSCCGIYEKEPLRNTKNLKISSNVSVSQAIFTPDSKLIVAVANTSNKNSDIIRRSDVVILEKCLASGFGYYLKNRGSLLFNGISNASFYLNKNYIIAIEKDKLKISIYDLNRLNQLDDPSSI